MITTKDKRWINLAAKTSRLSNHPKYRMVAIVVKGNRLLSIGINSLNAPKRFTRPHRDNMHLHAEVDALLNLDRNKTRGATIFIYGQTAAGNEMSSTSPCNTCINMIDTMGIKRVVYMEKGLVKEL